MGQFSKVNIAIDNAHIEGIELQTRLRLVVKFKYICK